MNNRLSNNGLEEQKSPLEVREAQRTTTADQVAPGGIEANVAIAAETINVAGNVSEQVGELASENKGGGNTGDAHTTTQKKQQQAQKKQETQLAAVQKMTQPQLVQGIKKEMRKEISSLTKKAQKIQRNMAKYSAYELNKILSQIRRIKSRMLELAQMALEKLREMYIKLVLKFKAVPVTA